MNVLPLALYFYKYVVGNFPVGFCVYFNCIYSSSSVSLGILLAESNSVVAGLSFEKRGLELGHSSKVPPGTHTPPCLFSPSSCVPCSLCSCCLTRIRRRLQLQVSHPEPGKDKRLSLRGLCLLFRKKHAFQRLPTIYHHCPKLYHMVALHAKKQRKSIISTKHSVALNGMR